MTKVKVICAGCGQGFHRNRALRHHQCKSTTTMQPPPLPPVVEASLPTSPVVPPAHLCTEYPVQLFGYDATQTTVWLCQMSPPPTGPREWPSGHHSCDQSRLRFHHQNVSWLPVSRKMNASLCSALRFWIHPGRDGRWFTKNSKRKQVFAGCNL